MNTHSSTKFVDARNTISMKLKVARTSIPLIKQLLHCFSRPLLSEMAEIASSLGKSTRIARFAICEDDSCSFPTTPHLTIRTDEVPLDRENAVAISYAWGEFDRQKRPIGHFCDGREVSMELGSEWVLRDVVERLAELSETKALWIDQLCMPQKEDQVAKALADIPSIFRTLDVVIFMPGNPCGCIPETLDELSKIPNDLKYQNQIDERVEGRKGCLGWGVSSWVRRLWPRQELMFSQRVRCVWASKEKRKCATQDGFQNPQDVPVFTKHIIDIQLRHSPLDENVTLAYAQRAANHYKQQVEAAMLGDYIHYLLGAQDLGEGENFTESFFRFLLGAEAYNGKSTKSLPEVVLFIMRLQFEMGSMRNHYRVRREATRPRDYVISIWTACPGYKIPDHYKSMEFSDLLQDAVDQFQKNHQKAFATTAPRGLFGFPCLGSALWKPADYLSGVVPAADIDVYRTLAREGWAFDVLEDTTLVPICIFNSKQPALSMKAFDYHDLIEMYQVELENNDSYLDASYNVEITPRFVELFHRAMKNWKWQRREALMGAFRSDFVQKFFTDPWTTVTLQEDTPQKRQLRRFQSLKPYLNFFLDHGANDNILDAYRQHLEPYIDPSQLDKLHGAIYSTVAAALELDVEYCEKKGVKLIFHLGDGNNVQPRVGFYNGDIGIRRKRDIGDCITVSMEGDMLPGGTLLYEAFSLPIVCKDEDLLAYSVFAVWVPTESMTRDEYSAQARLPEQWMEGWKKGVLE